jgi:hypothetical protein
MGYQMGASAQNATNLMDLHKQKATVLHNSMTAIVKQD